MLDLQLDPTRPIVFAADIHIKPRWSAAFPKLSTDSQAGLQEYLRVITETNACAIILGGDVFDVNYVSHVWLQRMFFDWVNQVVKAGCRVLAYPGNHDYVLSQDDQEHPVHIHSVHPDIVDIDREEFMHGERHYACIGHRALPQDLYSEFDTLPVEADTLLLHQLITDAGGSTNLSQVPQHIQQILIGDVHEYMDGETTHGAWWGYPGAMYPQRINETEHGVFIVQSTLAVPERKPITARKAKAFDVSEELQMESVLAQARMWVDGVLQQHPDDDHLTKIRSPVVQLRVVKHLVNDIRGKATSMLEPAYVQIKPVAIVTKLDMDTIDAKDSIPTPLELLPTYVDKLKASPEVVASSCPYPDESSDIVRELLMSGGAGRKAGDDERRPDGKPLAHKVIIQAALALVDKEASE